MDKTSIYKTGYIQSTNISPEGIGNIAYFKYDSNKFYSFILETYVETHNETFAMANALSDSMILHSTGSEPIKVSMQGYFSKGEDLNARDDFLVKYSDSYNGKALQAAKKQLEVHIRNTSFSLLITNIVINEDVSLEDYTQISITGLAYNYKVASTAASNNNATVTTNDLTDTIKSLVTLEKADG